MIPEIDELLADIQTLHDAARAGQTDLVIAIAIAATARACELDSMLPATLNKRKCHDCGNVAYHADNVVPQVLCRVCGSQDTRLIQERNRDEDD